jgi:hypothetical protein
MNLLNKSIIFNKKIKILRLIRPKEEELKL